MRRLLNAATVRQKFDGISDMTLWRWVRDPNLGFPQPIYIGRRRYFDADAVEAFTAARAATSEPTLTQAA